MTPSTVFLKDDERLRTYQKADAWVIFDSPSDYPGKHVARRFTRDENRPQPFWNSYLDLKPTTDRFVAAGLAELRAMLPQDRGCFPPPAEADECVVEVWI